MTTAAHDKLLIEPDNNAITEWVTVSLGGLFCMSRVISTSNKLYRPLGSEEEIVFQCYVVRAREPVSFGNTILAEKLDSRRHSTKSTGEWRPFRF